MVKVAINGVEEELRPSKMLCLLRSYAAHADEMRGRVPPRPQFFLKPPSSLLPDGGSIVVPGEVHDLHHEVELALLIGTRCKAVSEEEGARAVRAYLVMLDMTARDVQDAAKKAGMPWARAKGYDTFAPVSSVGVLASDVDYRNRRIFLEVNGKARQDSNTSLMMYSVGRIVSDLSHAMTLEPGDLILTGTPAGVGPVAPGDVIHAGIEGIATVTVNVTSSQLRARM
eukprot:m51a1_g3822 putative 2-hydroxyhepta- -diene- -dioate isomerase (227) ;mRNA; f:286980-287809